MANKQTGITLRLTAVDATSRAFKNVASSAAKVTASIAKWGGAAAAVAAGAFAVTANKLGKLSDVAQSAGATTEELTKLSGALDILGVKGSSPEELSAAFQRMAKTTGEVGVGGFYKVVAEIAKLPDIADRSAAAMQVFGKTGLNFMPVIEGAARNGVSALKDVAAAMPGISQEAADAGDNFSDAMTVMKNAASKVWNEGLMKVAELISGQFTGDVRTAGMVCAAQFEYFAKAAWLYIKPFITDTKAAFLQLAEWISRVMNNALTVIGGIIVTAAENFASHVRGVLDDIGAGAAAIIARLQGDREREQEILHTRWRESKVEAKDRAKNWAQTFKVYEDQLKWGLGGGPLGNVDLTALAAQRDAQIEAAKKAGEVYGKAAVQIEADERRKIGLDMTGRGKKGAENKQPEAILGGTYKAITYAMRQGYASGIEEVKNLLKKVVSGVKGVKDAVEANNLDLEAT